MRTKRGYHIKGMPHSIIDSHGDNEDFIYNYSLYLFDTRYDFNAHLLFFLFFFLLFFFRPDPLDRPTEGPTGVIGTISSSSTNGFPPSISAIMSIADGDATLLTKTFVFALSSRAFLSSTRRFSRRLASSACLPEASPIPNKPSTNDLGSNFHKRRRIESIIFSKALNMHYM